MSAWFSMLGEPLVADERRLVDAYLRGLGISERMPVEGVSDWNDARSIVTDPAWDRRWWDAEQLEKQRLYAQAVARRGGATVLELLSRTLESCESAQHAALLAATRSGCSDAGLVGSAAGSASEAFHLAELARLAGELETHPFHLKRVLFVSGRWPLGILRDRYRIF